MKDGFSSTGSAFGSLCRDRFGQQVLWSEVRTLGLLGAFWEQLKATGLLGAPVGLLGATGFTSDKY